MFALTFVDIETETSISIWEFEMMNVIKNSFYFSKGRYTIKYREQNENEIFNKHRHIILCMDIGISNWHN